MNPKLLTHPNIPKPLHGMNPRTVLGQVWWDKQRKIAYAKYDNHCWACGVHKSKAKYRQWLEAHESYKIDYQRGEAQLQEIVALCYSCHNFIHSGRLWLMYQSRKITKSRFNDVLKHGFEILAKAEFHPYWGTRWVQLLAEDYGPDEALAQVQMEGYATEQPNACDWDKWHLVIEGIEYPTKFKDEHEWKAFYAKGA